MSWAVTLHKNNLFYFISSKIKAGRKLMQNDWQIKKKKICRLAQTVFNQLLLKNRRKQRKKDKHEQTYETITAFVFWVWSILFVWELSSQGFLCNPKIHRKTFWKCVSLMSYPTSFFLHLIFFSLDLTFLVLFCQLCKFWHIEIIKKNLLVHKKNFTSKTKKRNEHCNCFVTQFVTSEIAVFCTKFQILFGRLKQTLTFLRIKIWQLSTKKKKKQKNFGI